jgi:oligopeptide/dipeptide ABC transporter ATP-binding protein
VLGETKTQEDGSRRFLNTIPGTLPDQRDFPPGCRFAPRCKYVMKKCWQAEPALVKAESGHSVRCYLHNDQAEEQTAYQQTYEEVKRYQKIAGR